MSRCSTWQPLAKDKIYQIEDSFRLIFPAETYGDLAAEISEYWISNLRSVWANKQQSIKDCDLGFQPDDSLSRIEQKTLVITYADSVSLAGEKTLDTLQRFLEQYFPAVQGMHMLPNCAFVEERYNDGFFSQIVRDRVHDAFGSNEQFAGMMERYYSMADFVLNHVDIDNPKFQAYLNGNDAAGSCFFVFSESEYQLRLQDGDFAAVFRPRPFPLFSLFRRTPEKPMDSWGHAQRVAEMERRLGAETLPRPVIEILFLFNKIKNDQMLLDDEYALLTGFRTYLSDNGIDPEEVFSVSTSQEVQHTPYVFVPGIRNREELLARIGLDQRLAAVYEQHDRAVFGEEIRAMTTFSHVQVDLNTATLPGLKILADDFGWYLSMDLNMLRLDAANYAFKRWKTSCYGLPEVKDLMKILYLSIDCVSPRIVSNLEVNDQLTTVLTQMADKTAAPPMMYDFHLASIMPLLFNSGDAGILPRIFELIDRFEIPETSIRFSLAESHDGKSVRGSMDLLTLTERQSLADVVEANQGQIKFKAVPVGQYSREELQTVCQEAGLDFQGVLGALFQKSDGDTLLLKDVFNGDPKSGEQKILSILNLTEDQVADNRVIRFFLNKLLLGKEPYELCCSTRDSMVKLDDTQLEMQRYLSFYTLALALMGRNVKSIYFNDLLALPNDYARLEQTGELRNLKRTKSEYEQLTVRLDDPTCFESGIARGMNDLIALVDSDPAFHFRGVEAEVLTVESVGSGPPGSGPPGSGPPGSAANHGSQSTDRSTAVVHARCGADHTVVVVNLSSRSKTVGVDLRSAGIAAETLYDNFENKTYTVANQRVSLTLRPFQRLWLTGREIAIPERLLS